MVELGTCIFNGGIDLAPFVCLHLGSQSEAEEAEAWGSKRSYLAKHATKLGEEAHNENSEVIFTMHKQPGVTRPGWNRRATDFEQLKSKMRYKQ